MNVRHRWELYICEAKGGPVERFRRRVEGDGEAA